MPVKLEGGDPPNAAEYCPDDRATEATSNSSLSHNAGDDLKRADEHEDEHDCGQESASIGNGPATSVSASRRKKGGRKLAVRTGAKKKQRKSAWQFAPYTRRSSGSRAKTVVGHRPQTRSQSKSQLNSAFEALEIGRCDTEEKPAPAAEPEYTIQEVVLPEKIPEQTSETMSRNRPRGPPTSRDNGLAANEETDMWNKLIQDLRKAKEKNDKQKQLSEQITALNEKIGREGNKPSVTEINQLDAWYRQLLKLSEEEKAILQDEPSDVIKNLGLLTALRSASEAEVPASRAVPLPKSSKNSHAKDGSAIHAAATSNSALPDKLNRVKGSTQRSSSVSSSGHARDAVSVKVEEGAEGAKGTIAERSGQFVIGAEVVFKHNKNKQGVEGEGIQCIIKSISGEGTKKRYDVQDPEPNENGEQGAVYKTTAASLIPIPHVGSALPSFTVGKQVLARYPDTTTFYRAEVMGTKKDVYRLKFEGEEDDKEMEVDKRFVLDIPTK